MDEERAALSACGRRLDAPRVHFFDAKMRSGLSSSTGGAELVAAMIHPRVRSAADREGMLQELGAGAATNFGGADESNSARGERRCCLREASHRNMTRRTMADMACTCGVCNNGHAAAF
jgi:hypothetical protein